MRLFKTIRGMRDFLPEDLTKRRLVEYTVRECFHLYGYEEIETPVIESLELIAAKAGDEIRHRMYSFTDLSGRKIALRPEMTASVARMVAGKLRARPKPLRLGYIANCFRYDNPQMGRFREFWQAGFELIGSEMCEADAEIIIVFHDLMRRLGFHDFTIKVGNVGIFRELLGAEGVEEKNQNIIMNLLDKRQIKRALIFLNDLKLSTDCKQVVQRLITLKGTDWMKIIDKGKETIIDNSEALVALNELEKILKLSQEGGVVSTLLVDLGFTRGLEYYTGMMFEVFVPSLRIALGGGGRYDRLVELFGGEPIPAVGCSPGIDRLVLALEKEGLFMEKTALSVGVIIIPVGNSMLGKALNVASLLRSKGVSVQMDVSGRDLRSSLSHADRKGLAFAVIVGSKEADKGSVTVRDMRTKTQKEVPITCVAKELKKRLPPS